MNEAMELPIDGSNRMSITQPISSDVDLYFKPRNLTPRSLGLAKVYRGGPDYRESKLCIDDDCRHWPIISLL